jgi:hypothetical protein
MNSSAGSLPDKRDRSRPLSSEVFRAIEAGALSAITVFLIGFILGTVRVLLLVPRLGETTVVMVEVPFMLTANWFVCRCCVDRLNVRRTVPTRLGCVPGTDIG